MATTKHTHPMVFGRREAGCPRCSELNNGAPLVRWFGDMRKEDDRVRLAAIKAHFASPAHLNGHCGPVCTFGEW